MKHPFTAVEIADFLASGELSETLYEKAYGYYLALGEMPYGTAKARTGDPYQWISDRLEDDFA